MDFGCGAWSCDVTTSSVCWSFKSQKKPFCSLKERFEVFAFPAKYWESSQKVHKDWPCHNSPFFISSTFLEKSKEKTTNKKCEGHGVQDMFTTNDLNH